MYLHHYHKEGRNEEYTVTIQLLPKREKLTVVRSHSNVSRNTIKHSQVATVGSIVAYRLRTLLFLYNYEQCHEFSHDNSMRHWLPFFFFVLILISSLCKQQQPQQCSKTCFVRSHQPVGIKVWLINFSSTISTTAALQSTESFKKPH